MDHSKLIEEIVSRVAAKLAESEGTAVSERCDTCFDTAKHGLLILTQRHSEICHAGLESEALHARFNADCALLRDYDVNVADYDVVVLYQLTNEALGKLATGVCDTPFTKLASEAILMGKKIYVPTEEVELYRYAATAPPAYYAMMRRKLDLLIESGMVICAQSSLARTILDCAEGAAPACAIPAPIAEPVVRAERELRLTKRLLSERDVASAAAERFTCIRLPAKCIITALARECAKDAGITLAID